MRCGGVSRRARLAERGPPNALAELELRECGTNSGACSAANELKAASRQLPHLPNCISGPHSMPHKLQKTTAAHIDCEGAEGLGVNWVNRSAGCNGELETSPLGMQTGFGAVRCGISGDTRARQARTTPSVTTPPASPAVGGCATDRGPPSFWAPLGSPPSPPIS